MLVLNKSQIDKKLARLAIEMLERNSSCSELVLLGVNNNGYELAKRIRQFMEPYIADTHVRLGNIRLNPAQPLDTEASVDIPLSELEGKNIIVIDDVANTGRTLLFALKPFFSILPAKVEIAVLVDRKHKLYPVQPDYFGLTLATTFQENIQVSIRGVEEEGVYLV